MPAPTGNANAEKWTLEVTLEKLKKIEDYAYDEDVLTLGQALSWARLYPGIWSYWKQRWADNEEVMEQIYIIDHCFVTKLMLGALRKRLHAGMAMFALRVNHGITDKHKEGEKPQEEVIPPHLARELEQVKEEEKPAPPLCKWSCNLPHIYTSVPPKGDRPYRKLKDNLYTIYTEEFCESEYMRMKEHQKKYGVWENWVLPPLDIDHTQMEIGREEAMQQAA